MTDRRGAETEIRYLAHHDSLTRLPNRAAFNDRLQTAIDSAGSRSESFAVLWIDLDRFKQVNDVFGHASGDELLCEVARRLQQSAQGAFVARLGGDEFALISLDGDQPGTAENLSKRLIVSLEDPVDYQGQLLRVGMSIGIAIFPSDGLDAKTLLGNADAALYRAKADRRGTIRFFDHRIDRQLRDVRALQYHLRRAQERDELSLSYQPQCTTDGMVLGFEALMRWTHPERGVVSPGLFIPAAEESGLIIPIGEWALREACREAASWPSPLRIAVNLSPVQFEYGDLPRLVHSALLESGLAPNRLELEITEGVLLRDFSRAKSILLRLKSLGVKICMDDFGTGYSSLSYLQSFPFDKIKIDQSFVSGIRANIQSEAIVSAIISLGRALSIPIAAEGVETRKQLEFLANLHCDEVQGFLIGRPFPIAHYAKMIRGRQAKMGRLRVAG